MPDRRTPFQNTGERDMLVLFLDYLRESVIVKASGLAPDLATRALVPSGTSLLGLVKHLTYVEVVWFPWTFAGRQLTLPESALDARDTEASVVGAYRAAIAQSNEIVAEHHDLDRRCARRATAPEPMSLRWVLVHMVEETARHAGHADILREQLDGEVGR